MSSTYRVRYSLTPSVFPRAPTDVVTVTLNVELEAIPGLLPATAYIMSIADEAAGCDVHWTRWPTAYRPGFGGVR